MGVLIGFVMVVAVAIAGGAYWWSFWDKVDPGNVGILVDYSNGSVEVVTETKWMWVGRYQKLHEYNAQQQVYVMDRKDEGQIKGDDAIECRTGDSQRLYVDAATAWRIDPSVLAETYSNYRDVPLTGPRGRDAAGNYLEDLIIRNAVRAGVYRVCPNYTWADILGTKQQKFEDDVEAMVGEFLQGKGVEFVDLTIRNRYPSEDVEKLMSSRLQGQQQEEMSRFQAAQKAREQQIEQDAARATALRAQIEADSKAQLDRTAAQAAADVARIKAEQEAEAIRSKGNAEAEALRAQASVVTPQLVDLERAKKWNGQGPTTVLGSDTQVINQVPR